MKKLTVLFCVFSILTINKLHATGIQFEQNKKWRQLLALAKQQKKIIFLDAYASWCGPCKYLQSKVFTQAAVGNYFNKTFINAKMDMEKDEGPIIAEKFKVTAYPTLFFISANGQLLHKSVGALEADELIALAHDAVNPKKQYFSLKSKAIKGELNPNDFLDWVKKAEQMDDNDLPGIIENHFKMPGFNLLNKDMIELALFHSAVLSDGMITDLKTHKNEIMNIDSLSSTDFNKAITQKAVEIALAKSLKDTVMSFDTFNRIVAKYDPLNAELETQKIKLKYYNYIKDEDKSLDALSHLFDTTAYHLPIDDLLRFIESNVKKIVAHHQDQKFISKIREFTLIPEDHSKIYLLDICQLLIYHEMRDKAKADAEVQKIVNNTDTPQKIKTSVINFEQGD